MINVIIFVIIFIVVVVFFLLLLKAASYSGRLQARFGYALAGSVSILVNKPAQIVQSYSEDAVYGLLGLAAAIGVAAGAFAVLKGSPTAEQALESEVSASMEEEVVSSESEVEQWANEYEQAVKNTEEPSNLKLFNKGFQNGISKVIGNPIYGQTLAGFGILFLSSSVVNTIASEIQRPILQYLAPEGVYFIDFNAIKSSTLNKMYQDLNESFIDEIKSYCNNPQSPECENIFMTYLIARDLYYTWGETLGQSVLIAGSHDEYLIAYVNYNPKYAVTQEGVLCMLGMMDFFGQSPLQQMYNMKLSQLIGTVNYDGDLVCYIANEVINSNQNSQNSQPSGQVSLCGSSDVGIPFSIKQKDVFETFEVSSNDVIKQYKGNPCSSIPQDYNILIPSSSQYFNGYIQYLYDGGTQGVIVSSVFGEQQ